MKKVAMVLSSEPQFGGEHQYALVIAKCLKELSDFRFDLIAICMNSFWCRWCRSNHIRYITLEWPNCTEKEARLNLMFPLYSRIYNSYMTELGRKIKLEQIDILFFTKQLMYVPNLNVKVITPVHDLMHRYEPTFPEVSKGYRSRELLFKCQAKYADYIFTDSKLGKRQFIESYLKINKKKPYIVCLPFIASNRVGKIKDEYIKVPEKYVFYPAQFWWHKNHINLIKAIQLLKEDVNDIHLVLVGSEKNCCKEMKKYIAENKLEDNISILGFVSDGNIIYLYKHAIGMIMPSYFGPTNIPPLEAMALGCPVAVSNKYAMPEQVGKAGLLFNPDSPEEIGDCIKKLWTDDGLRKRMIEMGYQRVRKWNYESFRNRIFTVLERCISRLEK